MEVIKNNGFPITILIPNNTEGGPSTVSVIYIGKKFYGRIRLSLTSTRTLYAKLGEVLEAQKGDPDGA